MKSQISVRIQLWQKGIAAKEAYVAEFISSPSSGQGLLTLGFSESSSLSAKLRGDINPAL
jgi:hypothetical protein